MAMYSWDKHRIFQKWVNLGEWKGLYMDPEVTIPNAKMEEYLSTVTAKITQV
jgi:hypothetical protein